MDIILKKRFDRAIEAMKFNNIDMWFFCGRETNILGEPSMLYLMPVQVGVKTAVIITSKGDKIVITTALEMEEMEQSYLFTQCILVSNLSDFEIIVTDTLKKLEKPKKLALNFSDGDPSSDGLTYTVFKMISRCLKNIESDPEIVSSSPIMKNIRGKKSDEEVALIKEAVTLAMDVFEIARPKMKIGMSGFDVQQMFKKIVDEKGYGYSWYEPGNPYVSIGTKSSYLCLRPSKDVFIQPGDLVNVDLGIKVNGFASDNQRSFYALKDGEKEPPEEIIRAFKTIQQINFTVCEHMKVGINSDHLTQFGNEIMLANGYKNGYKGGYGHEIGIFAHNGGIAAGFNPNKADLDRTLEYNMTFTLEPAIITSYGRLCQEEVVVVKEKKGFFLSTPQKEVWIIN